MAWREALLTTVGPGAFSGVTLGDWLRVLRENNYSIDWPYWGRTVEARSEPVATGSGPARSLPVAHLLNSAESVVHHGS